MTFKEGFIKLKNRCIHRWWVLPVYALVYFILFNILEKKVSAGSAYHVISTPLDHMIPFCEYFIIPYYLWFAFIMGTTAFFILVNRSRKEYYRFEIAMIAGMTIFLLISWLYPNGLMLRPETFPRDNIFTHMVQHLYKTDTPTNVFPSMHVYNSLCAYQALADCKMLKKHRWVVNSAGILTVLIIFATVFLKQHSVLDVLCAMILNFFVYQLVYRPVWDGSREESVSVG
jgi:membrane-associated phospholipid phosphatase